MYAIEFNYFCCPKHYNKFVPRLGCLFNLINYKIVTQYDFGPMGCGMKTNFIDAWKKFFILEEQVTYHLFSDVFEVFFVIHLNNFSFCLE